MSATKSAPIEHGDLTGQEQAGQEQAGQEQTGQEQTGQDQVIWPQGDAARLDDEIRRSMARLSDPAYAQVENARIGTLIDQRIELSYQRGLQAALASVRKK